MVRFTALVCWQAAVLAGVASAQLAAGQGQLVDRAFFPTRDHPAIAYTTTPASDAVAALEAKLRAGAIRLEADADSGYLRSVLDALQVPVESQMLVYSKTSLQAARIHPGNPRAIYFTDSVAVGWVRGGLLELAALDPRQGLIFYTLDPVPGALATFTRQDNTCLQCHESRTSLDIPGMLARSVLTAPAGQPMFQLGSHIVDHRTALENRWGGWYVTGQHGVTRHLGNAIVLDPDAAESSVSSNTLNVSSLVGRFDPAGYPTAHSDIAAHLVFDHQMHMMNLLARIGWESRVAAYARLQPAGAGRSDETVALEEMAVEFVDYLLFIDEAPLTAKVVGTSGFAEKFAARGPFDRNGRTLRQMRLDGRLMRYPCSYMIYSEAFDALPADARDAIYRRLWRVLSGDEAAARYRNLSLTDRQAIVEILIDTKKGLPEYFTGSGLKAQG
jgi:hypothetical protein